MHRRQVEGDEGGAAAEAQHGGIEGIADDAVAEPQNGLEGDDGGQAVGIDLPVQVPDRLPPVGIEPCSEHELAERIDAHDVPVVGAGLVPGLPGRGDDGAGKGDDHGALDQPEPGAQAPGGDPGPASRVAADSGHGSVCGDGPS